MGRDRLPKQNRKEARHAARAAASAKSGEPQRSNNKERKPKSETEFVFEALQNALKSDPVSLEQIESIIAQDSDVLRQSNAFDLTPLHIACRNAAPAEVVQLLMKKCPQMLLAREKSGKTPFHLGMIGDRVPTFVFHEMIQVYPQLLTNVDKDVRTPLHSVCTQREEDTPDGAPSTNTLFLIKKSPEEVFLMKDRFGNTPLNIACKHVPVNLQLAELVLNRCTGALALANKAGDLPLHSIFRYGKKHEQSEDELTDLCSLVELLASRAPETLAVADKQLFNTPLHLVCRHMKIDLDLKLKLIRIFPLASIFINKNTHSAGSRLLNVHRKADVQPVAAVMKDAVCILVQLIESNHDESRNVPSEVTNYVSSNIPGIQDATTTAERVAAVSSHFSGPQALNALESFVANEDLQTFLRDEQLLHLYRKVFPKSAGNKLSKNDEENQINNASITKTRETNESNQADGKLPAVASSNAGGKRKAESNAHNGRCSKQKGRHMP